MDGATAARPVTWALAALFLLLIDRLVAGLILWPVASFEDTRAFDRIVFGQTYRAARKLYAPQPAGKVRIALLGDSRMQMAVRDESLERAIGERRPGVEAKVHNLAIFGAGIGDLEMLARHLDSNDIDLAVIGIDHANLQATAISGLRNVPASLLRTGWEDGPLVASATQRLDRWLRTVWPLYRFRELARAAIVDRFWPDPTSEPWPERFPSMSSFLDYVHRGHYDDAEDAYRAWQREPTLRTFVSFLEVRRADYVKWVRQRAAGTRAVDADGAAAEVLEYLLKRLVAGGIEAVVLILPENPLLSEDDAGEYRNAESARRGAEVIEQIAARHGVDVIDARRAMPASAFFDLDHLAPDVAGFEPYLAERLVDAL